MTTSSADTLDAATSAAQSFVINLCSSTSPMALAHPSSPELKRYTFFVSRQREDGRERFRLHMGYFATQEQAEGLLAAVRDVYPAAWAGPAPTQGVARRGRISPVQLAPAVAQAANAAVVAKPRAAGPSVATTAAPAAPAPTPALEQTMSEMRNVLAQLSDDAPTVVAPGIAAAALAPTVQMPVVESPTVIAPTVEMPQPLPPTVQPSTLIDPPRLQPVSQPKVAAARPAAPQRMLTPAQTLKVLEERAPLVPPQDDLESEPTVRLLTPEDTQTLRDIKLDKANNAPPCFAVQLVWSVSPIEVTVLPHLAIFDAYTLYNVEGNRQGRRWYGLRLGFFSDPNSATQVANYVRSDYRSVAVVPVAIKERDHARGGSPVSPADTGANPPLKPTEQLSTNRETMSGFELVADDRPAAPKRDLEMPRDPQAAVRAAVRAKADKLLNPRPVSAPVRNAAPAPAVNGGGRSAGKRVVVRKRPDAKVEGAPGTAAVLESTLDILGASTLTLDEGEGKVLDGAAARRAAQRKKPANGKFSKLLSRLSGG